MRSLTLTLTEQCNLACSYCYARHSRRRMTEEVVDAAIDFWLASAGEQPRLTLSFYGGEPWLEPELMRRALARARSRVGAQQSVQCMAPTNGLLVDRAALDGGLELAVSIDAARSSSERRYADGSDSTPALLATLPALLPHAPLARMTVTPSNVEQLCQNVQAVARLGFRRIVFQPAWELGWDSSAIQHWSREHARLATWMRGARQAGARLPELPNLTGILGRLRRGAPRRACGAGVGLSAVATDGALFPCYRFVFGTDYRLGDVAAGITAVDARRELAAVRPDELCPEDGTCTTCAARDGCTHFCPALGHQKCGDLRAVPAVVCALSRAAVLATRSAFC
jgi:uncharacterized protein